MEEKKPQIEEKAQEYLIFSVDAIDFGVDITLVEEIIELQPVFSIPNSLEFCKGIINIRGTIVPVVDMRLKLGFPGKDYDDRACIIVVILGSEQIGMLVDKVQEVVSITEDKLSLPPLGINKGYTEKIACVDEQIKQILDVKAVFDISDPASS